MKGIRINNSARWSGIVRFLNFDIRSDHSTVLVSNAEYVPTGRICTVDLEGSRYLHGIAHTEGHGKMIGEFVAVVDSWVIKRVLELAI